MMKSSRHEIDQKIEDGIIKNVRNIFRLKKEIDDTTIKDIIRLKMKMKQSKRVIRDIKGTFF